MSLLLLFQSAANAYSLPVTTGTYAIAGNATALTVGRVLAVANGTYTIAGNTVAVVHNYKVSVSTGAYTINGNAVAATVGHKLPVSAGAYVISGNAVAVTVAHKLPVSAGAYAINGNAVALSYAAGLRSLSLAVSAGAYGITGNPVALNYSPLSTGTVLSGPGGSHPSRQKLKKIRDEVEAEYLALESIGASPASQIAARSLAALVEAEDEDELIMMLLAA